jgi:hypothetical protein
MWSKVVVQSGPSGPKWSKVVQSGPKWAKVVQSDPKWSNVNQSRPMYWWKAIVSWPPWCNLSSGSPFSLDLKQSKNVFSLWLSVLNWFKLSCFLFTNTNISTSWNYLLNRWDCHQIDHPVNSMLCVSLQICGPTWWSKVVAQSGLWWHLTSGPFCGSQFSLYLKQSKNIFTLWMSVLNWIKLTSACQVFYLQIVQF